MLDRYGNKTYDRGAFEEHGKQNFTDDNKGGFGSFDNGAGRAKNPGAKPSNGGWTPIQVGTIIGEDGKDYDVTFRQGLGGNKGQTLICDGAIYDVNRFHGHSNHNHYGSDMRYSNGAERIEDKGGDRGKCTGPGH